MTEKDLKKHLGQKVLLSVLQMAICVLILVFCLYKGAQDKIFYATLALMTTFVYKELFLSEQTTYDIYKCIKSVWKINNYY